MEDEIQYTKKKKWSITIIITFLISFGLEIFLKVYSSFSIDKGVSDLIPWTFHWAWEIAVLITIYIIVRRYKIEFGNFIAVFFLAMVISISVWFFIPSSYKVIKANYYGIVSRSFLDTHQEGRFDEQTVYDFQLIAGFLYSATDPELIQELYEAEKNNQFVETKGFLFWQTGLACGFIPITIDEYNRGSTILDHAELFFTVGPLVVVESFIIGIYSNFLILLLVQTIWFLFKREHIWWYK